MKVAYLIDKDELGGGTEYISLKIASRSDDECRVFYSARKECTVKAIDEWGAEEIIVNHLKSLVQLLGNPLKRPSGKISFVVHGIHLRKFKIGSIKYCLRRMLEAWLYKRCDRIIALTARDKDDILRLYGKYLKVDVEPNTLEGWRPNLAQKLPPEIDGDFRYLFIGRFDSQKGQDRWIRRIKECGGRTLFIGAGEELEKCKTLARSLGVADLCEFAGAIPNADKYLKCVPIIVSASRWEGMPYLMLKARYLGCEVWATNCAGNYDVLKGYEKWTVLDLP